MKLRGLLVSALVIAAPALAGCTPQADQRGEEQSASGDAAEAGPTLPQRLAFMAGHVEAGIALYRAGESGAGGPHLLHPVSESYAEEREGLDAIGFDPAPFEAVSKALEEGRPASEIEPQLAAAQANLAAMRASAGGEPVSLILYLMDLIRKEYAIGVQGGTVSDAGEYQDAWGFAKTARAIADDPATPNADMVRSEIDALIALWPDAAPIPPAEPASAADVEKQAERVVASVTFQAKAGN